jgi:hypothetical protein
MVVRCDLAVLTYLLISKLLMNIDFWLLIAKGGVEFNTFFLAIARWIKQKKALFKSLFFAWFCNFC